MNLGWVLLLWLVSEFDFGECLECYSCPAASDPKDCIVTANCGTHQACFIKTNHSSTGVTYELGCSDNQLCSSSGIAGPGFVGRALQTRQQSNCHECCTSNLCNQYLCSHEKPTLCIDSPTFDCGLANSLFNICKDIHHASTVCQRFCGLCDVVDGGWAKWTEWSECDVTCNNGTRTRYRTCTNPMPEHGGLNCTGIDTDQKICINELCPIHGGWSDWGSWDACSVSCDVGMQSRHRACSNPKPDRFGDHCYGAPENYRICMPGACADGGWSQWKDWEQCSESCGGGNRRRTRVCDNPAPSALGKACIGTDLETELCKNNDCKENTVAFHVNHVFAVTYDDWCIFDQVLLNEGHGYAAISGFFKAPSPGLFLFTATMCSTSGNDLYFGIAKGNSTNYKILSSVLALDVPSGYDCPSTSALVRMETGETAAVRLTKEGRSSGFIYQYGGVISTFFGIKVSA